MNMSSSSYFCLLLLMSLFPFSLSTNKKSDVLCMDVERQALLRFKHGLIDRAGRLASWVDDEKECCKWAGIVCDNVTGHVHQIRLHGADGHCYLDYYSTTLKEREETKNQMLGGNLSSSLLNLKQLNHLDLSCNDFAGIQVPSFIGSLRNLRYLNLSSSKFAGTIPPQLGNISELQVLCLGSFYDRSDPFEFTSIFNMHWLSNLRSLHHLDMSRVDLSKAINWLQVINTLPSLVELHLSYCHLPDIHPFVPRLNITSLSLLDLAGNYFDNSLVPRWVFSITSLVSLDLRGCNFHGPIPSSTDSFRNLTALKLLHVSVNDFMNSSAVLKALSSIGALLRFKHGLIDRAGQLASWVDDEKECCKWAGIVCDNFTGHVHQFHLRGVDGHCHLGDYTIHKESQETTNQMLGGNLSSSLLNLKQLKHLDLSCNDFAWIQVPSFIGGNLISLEISSCNVLSSDLVALHNLTSLLNLDLSLNQLTNTIPKSLGNLCNLRHLNMEDNNFENTSLTIFLGSFFECTSPSLESLSLEHSQLSGHLPYSIGRFSFLRSLSLGENFISGSIPHSIGSLSSLEMLDLWNNQLNGSLPDSVGLLSKLDYLDISYNLLTGLVTEAHFAKLARLEVLLGDGNNLALRPHVENWIPPFRLRRLSLSSWDLGPHFPLWLQLQRDLKVLDISNTKISSFIPESFWRSIPKLHELNMSQNNIQGRLFGIPTMLAIIDLSFNNFSGHLPELSKSSQVIILDLSHNSFVGSLRRLLCLNGGESLTFLNLADNQLSGVVPECWMNRPSLMVLNLQNNNLSGVIPRTLGSLSSLALLNMCSNKLSGRLPASLRNLTNLEILQLARNELVGRIPTWFGTEFSRLRLVNLRSNKFHGEIPHELCDLNVIQILVLAHNNLSGNIPRCFNKFSVLSGKKMTSGGLISNLMPFGPERLNSASLVTKGREDTYNTILRLVMILDLSSNNLSGQIPNELMELQALQSLNLSRNQLTGRIPEKIGDMQDLESFDVSQNQLSGKLPMSLSVLSFLSSFNVSYNNFTGRVPSSTQLQGFDESSFFGNQLCGKPLTKSCEAAYKVPDRDPQGGLASNGTDWGLVISMVAGFVVGFWIVLAPLIASTTWRIAYFRSLGNLRYLNLSSSKFGGTIPPQLGNLLELQVLCLGSFYDRSNGFESTSMLNMHWLSSLRSLHHLDMSYMDLSKAIDWLQVINTLPSLVELHLSYCQLVDIHPFVPRLNITSLSILDLSGNYFDNSSVPRWVFSITSLVSLDLSDCNFQGPILGSTDSFRNLTALKLLHVSGNGFMTSSTILKALSSIGGNLISLEMSYCNVLSSDLVALHNLTFLLNLDLSQNQLTNTIPKSLGNFCNLRRVNMAGNNFKNISLAIFLESFLECKSTSLESLSLEHSQLSGHLPYSIGRLSFLRSLSLGENFISGSIPYSIGSLSSLEKLDLENNQLNGSVPDSIGLLSKLDYLDISYNLLTGVVSETHFDKLDRLKVLVGDDNNLTLKPRVENWIPSFRLRTLSLSSWDLGPQFPLWLQLQRDLTYLDISNTKISSVIPEWFWRSIPDIQSLYMSENNIQGRLFGIPATLTDIGLSSNNFSGQLPELSKSSSAYSLDLSNNSFVGSLGRLLCLNGGKSLTFLNLADNQLSGVIPECWMKFPRLDVLTLQNNNLSGVIPRTLGSLSSLRLLNLCSNKLSGRLPASLRNLTNLVILQLARNELLGRIPTWFGRELSSLRILNLGSNKFHGDIPHELCDLNVIQILVLAHNNLSGNIPRCFNKFSVLSGKKMTPDGLISILMPFRIDRWNSASLVTKGREDTYSTILRLVLILDLSSNNFSGQIPSELMSLQALLSLNLSRNQLTGRIPEKIGNMKYLESFDVSQNQLSGELPMSLSGLSFLSSFNVSYNNFTGRVPHSTQLQSLDASSFFGNQLYGKPLTKSCEPETPHRVLQGGEGSNGRDWGLVISIVAGFVVGFWIVFAPLIASTTWRIAYFRFLINLWYMFYDFICKYCC
ncbi:hypothetical protein OSB04_026289 [Centaurea solstitialis]|uniref:Leucine-rich repeat-containing N-terminal plant-type domain-containing protein n=1 Tax=Centaurea solstitialis TaxID=347529 RepID=A0AA38SWP4_9ASTR|nr:hypothetical protein OSB04_026289 [Centaurea solstitialis]